MHIRSSPTQANLFSTPLLEDEFDMFDPAEAEKEFALSELEEPAVVE